MNKMFNKIKKKKALMQNVNKMYCNNCIKCIVILNMSLLPLILLLYFTLLKNKIYKTQNNLNVNFNILT